MNKSSLIAKAIKLAAIIELVLDLELVALKYIDYATVDDFEYRKVFLITLIVLLL